MPSVSSTGTDTVLEINHHLVHLNKAHLRKGSPGDFLGNIAHKHHNDSLHHHLSGHSSHILPGHHHFGTTSVIEETDGEESLIVVYALFLPLLATLLFIVIVALYVRRMRRTTSTNSVGTKSATQKDDRLTQYHNNGMEFSSNDLHLSSSKSAAQLTTTFSYPPRPKSVEMEFRSGSSKSNTSSSSSSSARTRHHGDSSCDECDSAQHNNKGLRNFGKFVSIINIPKRIKAHSAEKRRFNIYTVPIETREQLKQIYVY